MEVAVELEDDVFFANLSKQISMLIMDEDEDDPFACCHPADSFQAFSGEIYPPPQSFLLYQQAFRRESKGTGVFIPQSTPPRRKHKKGRSNSYSKYQRQSQETRMVSKNSCFKYRNGWGQTDPSKLLHILINSAD